jgi:hypothetical protein
MKTANLKSTSPELKDGQKKQNATKITVIFPYVYGIVQTYNTRSLLRLRLHLLG